MAEKEFFPFRDREDAARRLAKELTSMQLEDPVVLAIPRGGVVVGAELATVLGAELDVAISRKLRVPMQPELAFGALSEDGSLVLDHHLVESIGLSRQQIGEEKDLQWEQIQHRVARYRAIRPEVSLRNRSVIVTDDGIATGSTMMVALKTLRSRNPKELIVAVPVAPKEQLKKLQQHCDRLVCLHAPENFVAVGEFYEFFQPVEDHEVERLLSAAFGQVEIHRT